MCSQPLEACGKCASSSRKLPKCTMHSVQPRPEAISSGKSCTTIMCYIHSPYLCTYCTICRGATLCITIGTSTLHNKRLPQRQCHHRALASRILIFFSLPSSLFFFPLLSSTPSSDYCGCEQNKWQLISYRLRDGRGEVPIFIHVQYGTSVGPSLSQKKKKKKKKRCARR